MSEINSLITISLEDQMQFVAKNNIGCRIPIEPPVFMGGSGKAPNPIDYLAVSLGGCTSIKIISDLSKKGFKVDSFKMKVDGTRSKTTPGMFEKLHLVVTLSGDLEEQKVAEIIQEIIMHTCPVAAMFRKLFEITWELHILENDSHANPMK
ncbi:MAG: putative redox protein [Euryarchaeota archaeon]|nr:putative redox protein [Euryarchaeota archaeon]